MRRVGQTIEMRLLDTDEAKPKVQAVLDFVLQSKNWWRPFAVPDRAIIPPGDDKRHVAHLNTFCCVFSITVDGNSRPWRDLSISIPAKHYPHPYAFLTVARLFGFTGWDGEIKWPPNIPPDWIIRVVSEEPHHIRIAQSLHNWEDRAGI